MKITPSAHDKLINLLDQSENTGKVLRLFTNGFG